MTVGSLFSGIGGFDLAAERVWGSGRVRWQVEIDPFCSRVLTKHWPDVPRFGDIRELTGAELEPVDVVCGGFPCQPVSTAGKRRGAGDSRWLWPEMLRMVAAVKPAWVVAENVPGLLGLGLDEVLSGLEAAGYEVGAVGVPALAVGAPHVRQRLWIVAHDHGIGWSRRGTSGGSAQDAAGRPAGDEVGNSRSAVSNANGLGRGERGRLGTLPRRQAGQETVGSCANASSARLPQPGHEALLGAGRRDEGRAVAERGWWTVEPGMGRVAHGVPARVDRLRSLGNAIVPQIAEMIFRWIEQVSTEALA